jgi:hypothetical protein
VVIGIIPQGGPGITELEARALSQADDGKGGGASASGVERPSRHAGSRERQVDLQGYHLNQGRRGAPLIAQTGFGGAGPFLTGVFDVARGDTEGPIPLGGISEVRPK